MNPSITIRPAQAFDETAVMDLLEKTGFFRGVELAVAREVFCEAVSGKPECTYQSYVADTGGKAVGWVCFGPTPCTVGTFDMYWIAVNPAMQRKGIGKLLSQFAEEVIKQQNGRLIVVETSGLPQYEPTRRFYEKNDYFLAAEVPDFYAPGDSKCIYLKPLY
ncbi:MAG TPA: GNAT family N-acetyltransferase [Anaerohalosphaeraceae bacterium]|nr:GNAT family N-acetyltransferase [Anaerohalosphaeraceae bacterium]HQG04861.1 GNAT family N-acetyltransferase [Anaerohalosphaeraceae bacterium]HQI07396.1 GNAT family N-acetyltransferase [Anaerohalosphaeraceae bacterium]HQJ67704.1 GNAT family N-acetyltransferase [Anaerohalosphaeraceae bacterium]